MGFNFDITAAANILKNRYTEKKVETLFFQSVLLEKMPKKTNGGGFQYVGSIRNAVTSAISCSDAVAFTTGSPSTYQQWLCPWRQGFGSGNVTGAAVAQTNGDMNAFVDALVSEEDGLFKALGLHAGSALYGNGGGSIGVISAGSNVGTPTITLANPSQVANFYVGQIIQASATDGTSGSIFTGSVTLTGVDLNLGTLTASGNWTAGIASVAAGSFLFNQGDFGLKVQGLQFWIPDANSRANLSTLANNVTRSTDPVRLAGVAFAGKGAPKSETFIQTCALLGKSPGFKAGRGMMDLAVVNNLDYADVVKELSTRVTFPDPGSADGTVGFPGVRVATQFGNVMLVADPLCPQGNGWVLSTDTWLLISMGQIPEILKVDGLEWVRNAGADSYQIRGAYRAATYTSAPGWNASMLF